MNPDESQRELLLRYLDGRLPDSDRARVCQWLGESSEARAFLREVAEQAVMVADLEREARDRQEAMQGRTAAAPAANRIVPLPDRSLWRPTTRVVLAVAASIALAFLASSYFQPAAGERPIATVSGLSGALQWTGSGGRVVRDFQVGTELPGGTIEGLAPGSWIELTFKDGSTVSISGDSSLTLSDNGQKKLHLKEGSMSANVTPQPAGRPMLIHTRAAVLEVLGTRFEVEADIAATTLNVNRGTVRIKRLSDGVTVDVPARHRAIAAADREIVALPLPASVNRWRSHLSQGPYGMMGKWMPATGERPASLGTVPYTLPSGRTIHAVGFGISCGDRPPVTLQPGSLFRVRGRIATSHPVFFGVTLRHGDGAFAGKFQTVGPASAFPAGQEFEVVFDLHDFHLDPSLASMRDKLPAVPFDLVVESTWCHTLYQQAGLEVTEIELIPPAVAQAK
jgi:ferric-dicitrate binding protein FerR (iron transport regulator)